MKRNEIVDELDIVGLPDDIALDDIFQAGNSKLADSPEITRYGKEPEISESVLAHWHCALWSEGVVESDNNVLFNVEKACVKGLSQRCSGCNQLGATVKCRSHGCNKRYHYPCAVANGGFLDVKTLIILCPDHAEDAADMDEVDATCETCKDTGNVGDQLFCSSCGHRYHASCLQPTIECTASVRAGWQCPTCKTCQTCRYHTAFFSSLFESHFFLFSETPATTVACWCATAVIKVTICSVCSRHSPPFPSTAGSAR